MKLYVPAADGLCRRKNCTARNTMFFTVLENSVTPVRKGNRKAGCQEVPKMILLLLLLGIPVLALAARRPQGGARADLSERAGRLPTILSLDPLAQFRNPKTGKLFGGPQIGGSLQTLGGNYPSFPGGTISIVGPIAVGSGAAAPPAPSPLTPPATGGGAPAPVGGGGGLGTPRALL